MKDLIMVNKEVIEKGKDQECQVLVIQKINMEINCRKRKKIIIDIYKTYLRKDVKTYSMQVKNVSKLW